MERVYTTPLLDKLGIRPGMRVALIDIDDPDIRPLIAERTTDLTEGWPEPDTDVVLLGADSIDALAPLEALATRIRPNGAIWVVSRKGKAATLRDVEVMDAARGGRSRRQQGRVVLGDAHRAAPGHPGRPTAALTRRALYHPPMPDILSSSSSSSSSPSSGAGRRTCRSSARPSGAG